MTENVDTFGDVQTFLSTVRSNHVATTGRPHCAACLEDWPCSATRLTRAVEAVLSLPGNTVIPGGNTKAFIDALIAEHLETTP